MVRPPFLQQGHAARRPTPSWLAVPLVIIISFAAAITGILLFAPIIARLQNMSPDSGTNWPEAFDRFALIDGLVLISGLSILVILLLYCWVRFFERRPVESLGLRRPGLHRFFRGCLGGLGAIAFMTVGLAVFFNAEISISMASVPPQALMATLLMMPLAWVLQALSEELLFRGFLLQSIGLHHGLIIGALGSSLLFAGFHFETGASGFAYFAGLAALGFFLCVYATIENSLWGPIGFNVAWNFSQHTIFSISLADSNRSEITYFNALERSPEILSVTTLTAHFSVMMFVTALIMIIGLLIYSLQRRQTIQGT